MAYKLSYFNLKARGEPIRLIFAYAEVPYEDNRIERERWPEQKANFPWGKLPVLHVGNETLCQSKAICRYLGNKFNMGGEDYWESAKMDEISDELADLQTEFTPFFFEQDQAKKAEMVKEFLNTTAPKYFNQFEAQLKDNGGLYLVGKKLSWVDLHMAHFMEAFDTVQPGWLDRYPVLSKFKKTIYEIPQIKAWVDKRPVTHF